MPIKLSVESTEGRTRVIRGRLPTVQAAPSHMRKFTVRVEMDLEVEVSRRLIDEVLSPEWQGRFYSLDGAADVVEHLVFNVLHGRALRTLDGFANQPEDSLRIGGQLGTESERFSCEVTEVAEAKE
jgi:hypothetical protein